MTYQVLARKWRPKSFATLVGQEHVVRALTHALDGGRLHHAYLFTGTRGVGKTTLSRIFAKALNCETGITSTPCGVCRACREIDEGRFVDYVEMDAASNRGVEEMAALLERAVYAPVDARFKVYMIDEVHMLTNHAFNSMLKTLEEPPAHVKFILATTDPQKIPVTVLSRCLQFNLKQMPAGHIVGHLEHVLSEEKIPFEPQALRLLARSADGSMRDALSLTDQAIAYSANSVTEEAVSGMLGALDQSYLIRLLDTLATGDGPGVLAIADEMALRSLSFSTALQDLAGLLHRVAWAQFAPASVLDEWPEATDIRRFAEALSPEQVQLFYQIATIGRGEMGLAPDEYAGFTMTLLRMLAFEPAGGPGGGGAKVSAPATGNVRTPAPRVAAAGRSETASGNAGATASLSRQPVERATASAVAAANAGTKDMGGSVATGHLRNEEAGVRNVAVAVAGGTEEGAPFESDAADRNAGSAIIGNPQPVADDHAASLALARENEAPAKAVLPAKADIEIRSADEQGAESSARDPVAIDAPEAETIVAPTESTDAAIAPTPADGETQSSVVGLRAPGIDEFAIAEPPTLDTAPAPASASAGLDNVDRATPEDAQQTAVEPSPLAVAAQQLIDESAPSKAVETRRAAGGASAALDVLRSAGMRVSSDRAPRAAESTPVRKPVAAKPVVQVPAPRRPVAAPSAPVAQAPASAPGPQSSASSGNVVPPWDDIPLDDYVPASSEDDYFASSGDNFPPSFDSGPDDVHFNDAPSARPAVKPDARPLPAAIPLDALGVAGDWPSIAVDLPLKGIAYQLAFNSELQACDAHSITLSVPVPQYAESAQVAKLKTALADKLGRAIEVSVSVGPARRTAAALDAATRAKRQEQAEQEIKQDPFVQSLIRDFGASIVQGSIKPIAADNPAQPGT